MRLMKNHSTSSQCRLSKYNPKNRDINGNYNKNEWTEISDIGRNFDIGEFVLSSYLEVERSYIDAILEILKCNNINVDSLRVEFFPRQSDYFAEGSENNILKYLHPWEKIANIIMLEELLKLLLRYESWFRIESDIFFIRIWYDSYFYMWFFDQMVELKFPTKIKSIYIEWSSVVFKKENKLAYNPKMWKWWKIYLKNNK